MRSYCVPGSLLSAENPDGRKVTPVLMAQKPGNQ